MHCYRQGKLPPAPRGDTAMPKSNPRKMTKQYQIRTTQRVRRYILTPFTFFVTNRIFQLFML